MPPARSTPADLVGGASLKVSEGSLEDLEEGTIALTDALGGTGATAKVGDTVVATVMTNLGLRRHLGKHGIRVEMTSVGDPLIDALVAAAGEDQAALLRQIGRLSLGERGSAGGRDHQQRVPGRAEDVVEALPPRLGLHHHARPAAVGGVVHRPMPVVGVPAKIVDPQVDDPV